MEFVFNVKVLPQLVLQHAAHQDFSPQLLLVMLVVQEQVHVHLQP